MIEIYDQDGELIWSYEGDLYANIGEQLRVPWMTRKKIGDESVYVVEGTVVSVLHDLSRGAIVYTISSGDAD